MLRTTNKMKQLMLRLLELIPQPRLSPNSSNLSLRDPMLFIGSKQSLFFLAILYKVLNDEEAIA